MIEKLPNKETVDALLPHEALFLVRALGLAVRQREYPTARIEYPDPDSKIVEFGSRVHLNFDGDEEVYDVVTRHLEDGIVPVQDGVETLPPNGPLAEAILGQGVTEAESAPLAYVVNGRELNVRITQIDQVAQRNRYEANTLEAEPDIPA